MNKIYALVLTIRNRKEGKHKSKGGNGNDKRVINSNGKKTNIRPVELQHVVRKHVRTNATQISPLGAKYRMIEIFRIISVGHVKAAQYYRTRLLMDKASKIGSIAKNKQRRHEPRFKILVTGILVKMEIPDGVGRYS